MLDEVEELDLVLEHYAITWAYKTFGSGLSAAWADWSLKQQLGKEYLSGD